MFMLQAANPFMMKGKHVLGTSATACGEVSVATQLKTSRHHFLPAVDISC